MFKKTVVVADGRSVAVSHHFLDCDGPGCQTTNPRYQCSSCGKHYYCSKECQKRAWKGHKVWCKNTATIRDQTIPAHRAAKGAEEEEEMLLKSAKNTECAICLTEKMDRPIVLSKCQHAFCCTCLQSWDKTCRETAIASSRVNPFGPTDWKASCPTCRSPDASTDMRMILCTRSKAYMLRASVQSDADKKKSLYQKALAEIDKVVDGETPDSVAYDAIMWAKAKLYIAMGEGKCAVEIMKPLCSDIGMMRSQSETIWLEMQTTYAEALVEVGDYASAIEVGFKVVEATYGRKFPLCIQTDAYKMHCRCWYEVGNWNFCTRSGEGAAAMERYHAGVHKYTALGWKEEGDILMALETIGRAVLCEVDESSGSMEENMRLFQEIEAESQRSLPPIPTVAVSPLSQDNTTCALCRETCDAQKVVLDGCIHQFCYSCIKDWWIRHIRSANNKPLRFKGKQASCPICYEQIAQLPDEARQAFLCDA